MTHIPAYRLVCVLRLRQAGRCFAAFSDKLRPCGDSWRGLLLNMSEAS